MAQRVMEGWESVLRETGFEMGDIPDLAASFMFARKVSEAAGASAHVRPSWETDERLDGGVP